MTAIVTLTMNPTIDVSCRAASVAPEKKLRCEDVLYEPGGGGINVAQAIRQLGGEALSLWTCGGATGDLLRQLLDARTDDHKAIPIAGLTRHSLMVHDEHSDQDFRFGMPGPRISAAEAERCLARCAALDPPPAYLVASGSAPPGAGVDFYARLARRLDDATRLIVDTRQQHLRSAVEVGVFLIKPNLRELSEIVEEKLEDDEAIKRAGEELVAAGKVEHVLVSLGAGGAILISAEGATELKAPTVPIRSKVGAGDSMVGGLVLALSRGESMAQAAHFGVVAGAAAVMTPGTQLCRQADVEHLLAGAERP